MTNTGNQQAAKARFGSGGNGDSFYARGSTTSLDICQWLFENELSAYEYQCTRGVRISPVFANALKIQAQRYDIALSIHAPYYISMGSEDQVLQDKSIMHIMKSLRAAAHMGAERVVLHLGGAGKQTREKAMANAQACMERVLKEAEGEGLLEDTLLCPETMGKPGQLGNLQEILQICQMDKSLMPTLDFAHLHAINRGALEDKRSYELIFEQVEAKLGKKALQNGHFHFSPVEYGKGGEIRHRKLIEKDYGPDFYPLALILAEEKLTPVIICESAGTQVEDAASLQRIYQDCLSENQK